MAAISAPASRGGAGGAGHVVAPNFEAYRRFVLERLLKAPGVKDIRSSFALDVPKEAAPLPLEHLR